MGFAMLMGTLTDLIGAINSDQRQMQEKMQTLGQYLTWRKVPRSLFISIRKHLHYLWETNKGYDKYEDELKELLPPVLRKELCFHMYVEI